MIKREFRKETGAATSSLMYESYGTPKSRPSRWRHVVSSAIEPEKNRPQVAEGGFFPHLSAKIVAPMKASIRRVPVEDQVVVGI